MKIIKWKYEQFYCIRQLKRLLISNIDYGAETTADLTGKLKTVRMKPDDQTVEPKTAVKSAKTTPSKMKNNSNPRKTGRENRNTINITLTDDAYAKENRALLRNAAPDRQNAAKESRTLFLGQSR